MKHPTVYATVAAALMLATSVAADVIKIEGVFDSTDPAHKLKWIPNEVKVKSGDVIEWHAKTATHGVMFEDWDKVKAVLKIEEGNVEKQPKFPLPAQGTAAKAGEALLLKATIQEFPGDLTEIPFFCTQHGPVMSGKLVSTTASPPAAKTTPEKKAKSKKE